MLIIACTKDIAIPIAEEKGIRKHYKLSDEIKAWALFKPGSYWIVRDSVTNVMDSVYVASIVTNTITKPSFAPSDTFESAEETIINFKSGGFVGLYSTYTITSYKFDQVKITSAGYTIFQPDTNGHNANITEFKRLTSTTIGGNVLNEVTQITYAHKYWTKYGYTGLFSERSSWKKNVGVIKRTDLTYFNALNPKPVEMVRYNVIQ